MVVTHVNKLLLSNLEIMIYDIELLIFPLQPIPGTIKVFDKFNLNLSSNRRRINEAQKIDYSTVVLIM